jgi:glycosyltransferase involved in cell wall biosynthesis
MVRDLWGREAEAVIESGTSPHPAARPRRYSLNRPLEIVWSGQHLGRKALPILLQAMRLLPATAARLTVLGAGSETGRWKAAAAALGVADRVVWTGNLARGAALDRVAAADVMAFTSVQEGTPHAVLEALSLGVPVVCHDACGMGHAVTGACGIKVPMTDPRTSVAGFAFALRRLGSGPGLVERLSLGALRRAEELSWDHLAERIGTVYSNVATKRPSNR